MELHGILTHYEQPSLEKHSQPSGTWIVEGYASTTDLDSQDDIVTVEAMKMGAESLMKFGTVLFNHDMDRPIGRVIKAEVTDGGLLVKVSITKSETKLWELVKDGTLSKFSIRGKVTDYELQKKSEFTEEQIRVIKGMEIVEVSLVSVPANPNAKALAWYIEKYFKSDATVKGKIEDCVQRKVPKLLAEGMPKDQAVAVAFSMCEDMNKEANFNLPFSLEIKKDQDNLESAIKNLEASISSLAGEDVDQVKAIIRSLTALVGRVYAKGGKDLKDEVKKGEQEVKDEVKPSEEEVKKADSDNKEEAVKDSKEEVKKSSEAEKVQVNVDALSSFIEKLQGMAKDMTEQMEKAKSDLEEANKAKEEVKKAQSDIAKAMEGLTKVIAEIPLRKAAAPEKEEKVEEQRVKEEVNKDLFEDEKFSKLRPFEQMGELVKRSFSESQ